MTRFAECSSEFGLNPRTLHYCSVCKRQTLHEILMVGDSAGLKCLPCADQALCFELDRD